MDGARDVPDRQPIIPYFLVTSAKIRSEIDVAGLVLRGVQLIWSRGSAAERNRRVQCALASGGETLGGEGLS